jgi:integrase/recombinase XerC/integrase/recombinase XerD
LGSQSILVIDHLIHGNQQAQTGITLGHLIFSNDLSGWLKSFLIAGKVEGLAEATLDYYKDNVDHFVKFLNGIGINHQGDVTSVHIRLFMCRQQERGNQPASIHCYYRAIKRFFNWMVAEGELGVSPVKTVRPPKIPDKVVQPFNAEQLLRMLLLCDRGHFVDLRNRALILLFVDTGVRVSEMLRMQLRDIDLQHGLITVHGKGTKERVVPMQHSTQKALMAYLRRRNDNYTALWLSHCR